MSIAGERSFTQNIFNGATHGVVQKVEITRPRRSGSELWGMVIGRMAGWFLDAFLLMLIVPQLVDFHPGYWKVWLFVLGVRILFPQPPQIDSWSRRGGKA